MFGLTDDRSVKVFKTKLKQWGIRKNIDRREAIAILSVKRKHDALGGETLFLKHEKPIDLEDIERYARRAKLDHVSNDVTDGGLPDGIECIPAISLPPSLSSSHSTLALKTLFHFSGVWVDSCFDRGLWHPASEESWLLNEGDSASFNLLRRLQGDIYLGCQFFTSRKPSVAGACLRRAFDSMSTIVTASYHNTLPQLTGLLARLRAWGFTAIANTLLHHLSALASIKLPLSHPHRQILQSLLEVPFGSGQTIILPYHRAIRARLSRRLGGEQLVVKELDCQILNIADDSICPLPPSSWHDMQAEVDKTYGCHSLRAMLCLSQIVFDMTRAKRYKCAETLALDLVRRIMGPVSHAHSEYWSSLLEMAQYQLAEAQLMLGKYRDWVHCLSPAFAVVHETMNGPGRLRCKTQERLAVLFRCLERLEPMRWTEVNLKEMIEMAVTAED